MNSLQAGQRAYESAEQVAVQADWVDYNAEWSNELQAMWSPTVFILMLCDTLDLLKKSH